MTWAQYAPANPDWNRPVEPFRIAGNIYYVGAADVSSYLIATPAGNILLDTGFSETVPQIESNLAKLGFRMEDTRLLLFSHAHYDHAGGLAAVKARTGATLVSSAKEADLLAHGGKNDFAFGDKYAFRPAVPDRLVADGDQVSLGGTTLTAHVTAGHTKGCTTWTTRVEDGRRSYDVVFVCSVTAPGYQLVDNPKYPGILKDFDATFAALRALPCDIFLGGHGWEFGLAGKAAKAGKGGENPFVDREGYRSYLDRAEAAIHKQAEEQRRRDRPVGM